MGDCGCKNKVIVGPVISTSSPGCCSPTSSVAATCCNTAQPSCPTPFYDCSPQCQEDTAKNSFYLQFRAVVKTANSFNVPDCGGSAIVQIPGLTDILLGSFLWNSSYGYFQVIAFNVTNGQVTIQNNCNDGNQPAGTQVPACTDFVVSDPPSSSQGGGGNNPNLFPFVAIDFTAPADSTCLDITVTTVNGLAVGKNVQIGSGVYRLNSIPSSTIINICNDGAGITPGTSVIAQNAQGQYQYPIVLIDVNPCTNDTITSGSVLACDGNVAGPLTGAVVGSVLVLQDIDTGEAQYQALDVPTRTCTAITCCLTLVPAQTLYTIPVADSSQFTVGDVTQIGTRTDRFTITDIPDGTHITGILDPAPGALVDIPPGTSLCIVDCCEALQTQIDVIVEELDDPCNFPQILFTDLVTFSSVNLDFNPGQQFYDVGTIPELTDYVDYVYTNTDDCSVLVNITVNMNAYTLVIGAPTDEIGVQHDMLLAKNGVNNSLVNRQILFFWGTDQNDIQAVQSNGAPAGFVLDNYPFMCARPAHFEDWQPVGPAGVVNWKIAHRLSFSNNWNDVPWGGSNKIQWSIQGEVIVKVWRIASP